MKKPKFEGDKKKEKSWIDNKAQKVVDFIVPYIPKYIETYHLTFSTILWSLFIIVFSFFAKDNINWLWLVSLMILFQYITDVLDGAVGRYRNTGLIKWGYYMDHFLDYIFLCSVLIGYSFIVEKNIYSLFFILALFGAFMVNSYLDFAATNKFKIVYLNFGPTETRILFIVINTLFVIFGKTYLSAILPCILIFSLIGLCIAVYRTQREIWEIDMRDKRENLKLKSKKS